MGGDPRVVAFGCRVLPEGDLFCQTVHVANHTPPSADEVIAWGANPRTTKRYKVRFPPAWYGHPKVRHYYRVILEVA